MPTYAYACTDCDHSFETVQSFSDDSLTECPECHGRLRKVYANVGVVFKGSGFYRNDSRTESGAKNGSAKESGKDSGKESKEGAKTSGNSTSGDKSSSGSSSSDSSGSSPSTAGSSAGSAPKPKAGSAA